MGFWGADNVLFLDLYSLSCTFMFCVLISVILQSLNVYDNPNAIKVAYSKKKKKNPFPTLISYTSLTLLR